MPSNPKLLTRTRLLAWRDQLRADGKSLVQCHGCFDIVHPGHISHLQQARALGDVLLVSVSSDANVNKGPARPLIPDDLRAASLAALECVDGVFVNDTPTAVDLLQAVQPDVYVKGREYERSADPRFIAEQDVVIRGGGRVAFTSGEIVYSSTAIINQLTQTDPFEREKLDRLRQRYDLSPARLAGLVRDFEGKKVVVVGDYICDRYHFCDATSIASEGPMMTLRLLARRDYDGGAAVVARHAAAMGASATLVTHLGDDAESAAVRNRLASAGVETRALSHRRQLVTKHRYLCETTKVLKVDEGPVSPLDSAGVETLHRQTMDACDAADLVIFCDFGYGLLTATAVEKILPEVRKKVPVVTGDVSGRQGTLTRFRNLDLVTPTEREIREGMADFGGGLNTVAWQLMHDTAIRGLIVTLGRQGAVAFDRAPGETAQGRLRSEHVPATTRQATDPLGCGDALLAAASLTLAAGGSLQAATLIGSISAGLQATRLGNDAISAEDLVAQVGVAPEDSALVRLAS